MNTSLTTLAVYLLLANLVALFLYGYDKRCALLDRWRVPESTLLASAVIGGSLGALTGMVIFRHKTRKLRFRVVVFGSIIVQVILIFILLTHLT